MNVHDLDAYEADMELQLYREYRDVVGTYAYRIETERRLYLGVGRAPNVAIRAFRSRVDVQGRQR